MFIMREFKPQTSLLETPRSASYPKDHWQLKVCIEFILQWPNLTGEWPISGGIFSSTVIYLLLVKNLNSSYLSS